VKIENIENNKKRWGLLFCRTLYNMEHDHQRQIRHWQVTILLNRHNTITYRTDCASKYSQTIKTHKT